MAVPRATSRARRLEEVRPAPGIWLRGPWVPPRAQGSGGCAAVAPARALGAQAFAQKQAPGFDDPVNPVNPHRPLV
jgi:hypothetical protein